MTNPKKKKQNKKQQPKTNEPEKIVEQDEVIMAKESEDNNSEPQNETIDQSEESYSIYEYLKKNPAVLIAVVSGLIAIISTGLKLSSYFSHIGYLKSWNINAKFVSTSETYRLEDIGLSFAFLVVGLIYMILTDEAISVFKRKGDSLKPLKKEKKSIKHELKEYNKKKEISKNDKKINEMKKSQYDDIKNDIIRTKKESKSELFRNLILYSLIFGSIVFIFFLRYSYTKESIILYILCSFVYIVIILVIPMFFFFILPLFIGFFKKNNKHGDDESKSKMYPIKEMRNLEIKYFLSNENLFKVGLLIFIISISFVVIEYSQGKKDAENLKNHICVIKYDEKDYAIIAQDTDNIIAERIVIKGSSADIYVNEQILIPKEKIEMEVHSFEKIHKK